MRPPTLPGPRSPSRHSLSTPGEQEPMNYREALAKGQRAPLAEEHTDVKAWPQLTPEQQRERQQLSRPDRPQAPSISQPPGHFSSVQAQQHEAKEREQQRKEEEARKKQLEEQAQMEREIRERCSRRWQVSRGRRDRRGARSRARATGGQKGDACRLLRLRLGPLVPWLPTGNSARESYKAKCEEVPAVSPGIESASSCEVSDDEKAISPECSSKPNAKSQHFRHCPIGQAGAGSGPPLDTTRSRPPARRATHLPIARAPWLRRDPQ